LPDSLARLNLRTHFLDLRGLLFELGCERLYLVLLLRDRRPQVLNFEIEHGLLGSVGIGLGLNAFGRRSTRVGSLGGDRAQSPIGIDHHNSGRRCGNWRTGDIVYKASLGRLTATVNGTWLSRAELQILPATKRFGIAGEFIPPGLALTGSLPWSRANFSLFYDGPAETWLVGLDVGAVVHYTGQYADDNVSLTGSPKVNMPRTGGPNSSAPFPHRAREVRELVTLDLIASYTFNLPPPAAAPVPGFAKDGGKNVKIKDGKEKNVIPISTAEYNPCGWCAWLNNTTISLGMQNVFDEDPPFVAGAFENGYDESLATIKGRFWYVQLKKRF
jgi:outer membrane receptor protein involved in Fe transport